MASAGRWQGVPCEHAETRTIAKGMGTAHGRAATRDVHAGKACGAVVEGAQDPQRGGEGAQGWGGLGIL